MAESTAVLAAEISRLLKERRELAEALMGLVSCGHYDRASGCLHTIPTDNGPVDCPCMVKARNALVSIIE